MWTTTQVPTSFALEPVYGLLPEVIMVPAHTVVSPHLTFDQSEVHTGGGWSVASDATAYTASVVSCASCTASSPAAWFVMADDGDQEAWANASMVFTETLELGSGELLRFDAEAPPKSGTVKVVEAW